MPLTLRLQAAAAVLCKWRHLYQAWAACGTAGMLPKLNVLCLTAMSTSVRKQSWQISCCRCCAHTVNAVPRKEVHATQDYILPAEYVNTMRDYMLDKCPVSTYKDIAQVIQEDLGKSPGELFASIEEVPIASASLAQVTITGLSYAATSCERRLGLP